MDQPPAPPVEADREAAARPADDEARFLAFARGRDATLLERLLREHADRAFTQARYLLGSSSDAEDAVQEAFLQLVRSAERYDASVPFAAWLGRLVYVSACAIRRSRSRRLRREREAQPAPIPRSDEDAELKDRIRQAVGELPETYRAPLVLHYFSGLDQRGTAAALGISVEAVGMRLSRARERLRATLKRAGVVVPMVMVADALVGSPAHAAPVTVEAGVERMGSMVATGSVPTAAITTGAAWWWVALVAVFVIVVGSAAIALHMPPTTASPPTARRSMTGADAPATATLTVIPVSHRPGSIQLIAGKLYFHAQDPPGTDLLARLDQDGKVVPVRATGVNFAGDGRGNLWVLGLAGVTRIGPDGQAETFPYGGRGTVVPAAITCGPDGNMWFALAWGQAIGRVTAAGEVTLFPLTDPYPFATGIVSGADGRVYIMLPRAIGTMTSDGVYSRFLTLPPGQRPESLVRGHDGRLWYIDGAAPAICRVGANGEITEFRLADEGHRPLGLLRGPLGRLWFTTIAKESPARMCSIDADGRIAEHALPIPGAEPYSISAESETDGTEPDVLWVLLKSRDRVVRFPVIPR